MWVFEYRTFCFKCIYYRVLPDHFMLTLFFTWLYLGNSTALICVVFLFIFITVIFIIIIIVTIAIVYQFPSFYLFFFKFFVDKVFVCMFECMCTMHLLEVARRQPRIPYSGITHRWLWATDGWELNLHAHEEK